MTPTPLSEDLKPCPFCASKNVVPNQVSSGGGWGVLCRNCHAYQDTRALTQAEAIAAWNRRAPLDALEPALSSQPDRTEEGER